MRGSTSFVRIVSLPPDGVNLHALLQVLLVNVIFVESGRHLPGEICDDLSQSSFVSNNNPEGSRVRFDIFANDLRVLFTKGFIGSFSSNL